MLFKPTAVGVRDRSPWLTLVVSLLLAIHITLAMGGIYGRSVTSDETAHLTAGLAYWQFDDYRLQPENGNLPQRWCALPVLAIGGRLDPRAVPEAWETSMVWLVAQDFLFDSGRDADAYVYLSRCAMVLWSAGAGLLVFFWSRSLWGNVAGVASLALFSFSPTTLAHGPLITSDMCGAFFLLAAAFAGWKACAFPSARRVIVAGLVFGLTAVAKFSAPLLVPTMALVVLTLAATQWREGAKLAARAAGTSIINLVIAGTIAGAVVWTFYGWRFLTVNSFSDLPELKTLYLSWSKALGGSSPILPVVKKLLTLKLLPEPFLFGVAFIVYFSSGRGGFLLGKFSTTGWWWFFPFAFLIKSTLGELLVTLLLAIALLTAMKAKRFLAKLSVSSLLPLVSLGLVYGVSSITSDLNIGQRHILPLYLILFILAGGLFRWSTARSIRITALFAVLLSAGESLANFPNPIAFFNLAAGGPKEGWRLLSDSSIDWGQDVAPMAKWVRANRIPREKVYVSTFGTADPWHEGIPAKLLAPYFSLGASRNWYQLEAGLYCVSATMLQDVYGLRPGIWDANLERDYQQVRSLVYRKLAEGGYTAEIPAIGHNPQNAAWLLERLRFGRLCFYLRERKPDAIINHSIFIFRLSAHEVHVIADRPFSELVDLVGKSSTAN